MKLRIKDADEEIELVRGVDLIIGDAEIRISEKHGMFCVNASFGKMNVKPEYANQISIEVIEK